MIKMSPCTILLFMAVAIPTTAAQETCVPVEYPNPDAIINCTAIDSVFLSCACNVYQSSILEIMSTLSCSLGDSGGLFTGILQPAMPTVPIIIPDVLNTFPPQIDLLTQLDNKPANFLSGDGYMDQTIISLLENITKIIGGDVMDKLCSGLSRLEQCAGPDFAASTSIIDMGLKILFRLENIGSVLGMVCDNRQEAAAALDCLAESIMPVAMCMYLPFEGLRDVPNLPFVDGTPVSDRQQNFYCQVAGDALRCASIQLKNCSPKLGYAVNAITTNLLSTTCQANAAEGTDQILASTFVMCGLTHIKSIMTVIMTMPKSPSSSQIMDFAGNLIDFGCSILPDYFKCVYNELTDSKNSLDLFIQNLIDKEQLYYGAAIAAHICKADRIQAIQSMIPCVVSKERQVEACGTPERVAPFERFNPLAIGLHPETDRKNFCGPMRELFMCMNRRVVNQCNLDVGVFMNDMYLWIMRTDCYGARNGTFQEVIQAEKQKGVTPNNSGNVLVRDTFLHFISCFGVLLFLNLRWQ